MQQSLKIFLKRITVFTVIVAALLYAASTQLETKWVSSSWPFVVLFFFSFTIIMHRYLLKSTEGNPKKFVFSFLMITTVKILLYLGVILVYVLLNMDDAVAFIMVFFVNYFLYTGFELATVMKLINQPKS